MNINFEHKVLVNNKVEDIITSHMSRSEAVTFVKNEVLKAVNNNNDYVSLSILEGAIFFTIITKDECDESITYHHSLMIPYVEDSHE